jgi:quinol monooxygenase YgiN
MVGGNRIQPREEILIHVLAILTAKPGLRGKVLEAFRANAPNVLAEDGCIEYGAAVDIEGANPAFGPDTLVIVEKWRDLAALKAHGASPHMKAYSASTKEWMATRAVHALDPA